MSAAAGPLVRSAPELIVTSTAPMTLAVKQLTATIPVVFVVGGDVFENALVQNIGRPEANVTGVTNVYESIRGKWLELLGEAAPHVKRVGIIHPDFLTEPRLNVLLSPIEQVALAAGTKLIRISYGNPVELVRRIDEFTAEPNGGLVMLVPLVMTAADRDTVVRLALEHRIPLAGVRETAAEGGLIGYGPNTIHLFRRAASFVDRILRGAKVGELPVEFPTKFEMAINLKTAKALGLTIPESLLLRADEVIE